MSQGICLGGREYVSGNMSGWQGISLGGRECLGGREYVSGNMSGWQGICFREYVGLSHSKYTQRSPGSGESKAEYATMGDMRL